MKREEFIDKYFTNIQLEKAYPDAYYVRKSIFSAIQKDTPKFKGVLLDVGCGIMPYREYILGANKQVTSYIGMDFESALDSEYALGKPDLFWTGDRIPMEDHSADTILATELFEHCPDPEKVMREMLRVLRPSGILFFTVPFLWNLHLVPYDEYRYTPYSLERLLKNSGFVQTDLLPLGGWDASLAQMLAIWLAHRPMPAGKKNLLARIVLPVIKKLIRMDPLFDKASLFTNGGMITGLYGTAYAP